MTQRKTLRARMRTNNKLNPHVTSGPGSEPRLQLWKGSALTTVPSLLPLNILFRISFGQDTIIKMKCHSFEFQASFRKVIIAEKTSLSSQYFYELQKFIVMERGLVLLPVASPVEAGRILAQMVSY